MYNDLVILFKLISLLFHPDVGIVCREKYISHIEDTYFRSILNFNLNNKGTKNMAISPFALTIAFINATGYTSTNLYYLIAESRRLISLGWSDLDIKTEMEHNVSGSTEWSTFTARCDAASTISNWIYSPSSVYTVESLDESALTGMSKIKTFRVTSLPDDADLVANAIYYYKDDKGRLLVAVTGTDKVPVKLAGGGGGSGGVQVFETYAAMTATSPIDSTVALVLDATGDGDVETGSASYIWNADDQDGAVDNQAWILTAEHDTINVATGWDSITDNPFTENTDDATRPDYKGSPVALVSDITELAASQNLFSLMQW